MTFANPDQEDPTMKPVLVASTLFAALFLLSACGGMEADAAGRSAAALTAADCASMVETLESQTAAVEYTSARAARDEQGLLDKLSAAEQKLQLGKRADAVQKLQDYSGKVQQLVAGGKIAPSPDGSATPQALVDGASAAIACIQAT